MFDKKIFSKFIYKKYNILSLCIFMQLFFCNNQSVEYIIYTSYDYNEQATEIANLYKYNDCTSISSETICNNPTHCIWGSTNCIESNSQINPLFALNTQILYSDYTSPDNISPISPNNLSSYLYNI